MGSLRGWGYQLVAVKHRGLARRWREWGQLETAGLGLGPLLAVGQRSAASRLPPDWLRPSFPQRVFFPLPPCKKHWNEIHSSRCGQIVHLVLQG